MAYVITPYVIVSACSAIFAAVLAILSWRRRRIPGGTSLALVVSAVTIWAAGAAMEYAAVDISSKIAWSKFEYIGSLTTPVFFLLFTLEYNRLDHWLSRRIIAGLLAIPLITLGLAVTNELHGLIWTGFYPNPLGKNLIIYEHGAGFWIGVVIYPYLCMFIGTALLIWDAVRYPIIYRPQSRLILAGAIIPWVGNMIYVSKLNPIPGLELTPLAFVFSGIFFAWSVFRFQLLNLVPVARDILIESMSEGMLVIDEANRVVDMNLAGQGIFKINDKSSLGKPVAVIFERWPELVKIFREHKEGRIEIILDDKAEMSVELNISLISDRHSHSSGRLVIVRDISERKRAEEEIRITNERLRNQLAEIANLQEKLRDQAIRDSLTGLFNRRYLDETLGRELDGAARDNKPVCVVMLDIDRFKNFNDAYGHDAGDVLLRALGRLLKMHTRSRDIACRYGGEEFILVLPGISARYAFSRIEQLRTEFANIGIPFHGQIIKTTLSGGMVTFPDQGESADEILKAVDKALYAAKAAGRNCLVMG